MDELELIGPDILQLVSPVQAWHYRAVPVEFQNGTVRFLMDESANLPSNRDELELQLGQSVKIDPRPPAEIQRLLGRYYRRTSHSVDDARFETHEAEQFIEKLIGQARELGSSDIHIEIFEERARVRFRIDGHLVERYKLDKGHYPALINRIKILARLDIAEKRLPQDGRMSFEFGNEKFDMRISTLPTLYGEKVVMRLLNKDTSGIDIRNLGMSTIDFDRYLEGVRKSHGIVLISGPTGSGKTTTLYATMKLLNEERRNILTVEDPVEYTLEGINQVQLRESIGLSFASALRSFLRQDPDIIMLGEIRDSETAEMAVRAALTGHLVLSTIHTNSAWDTLSRLSDMGIPSFLVANTLNLSVAQRLVRKLCAKCKRKEPINDHIHLSGIPHDTVVSERYVSVGCEHCHFTGYSGRMAIYEVIPVNREVQSMVRDSLPEPVEWLRKNKVQRLSENALDLYRKGLTSYEEIYTILAQNEI